MDSSVDTLKHIKRVNELLLIMVAEFLTRAANHDNSKLGDFEKPYFDTCATKLKQVEFGSPEYYKSLEDLKPALDHHYKNNSHHPQHYENGIDGMNLFDVFEMLLDWKAAGERHPDKADGSSKILESIRINKDRFGISDQLAQILINTVNFMKL